MIISKQTKKERLEHGNPENHSKKQLYPNL